jgi:hypothetical protein
MLQEVFNNHMNALILLGPHEIPWNDLRALAASRRLRFDRFKELDRNADWPMVLRITDFADLADPEHLVRLMISSKACEATDLRVKIYALLPMLSEWDRKALPADYKIGVVQLNMRVARYLARHDALFIMVIDQVLPGRLRQREELLAHLQGSGQPNEANEPDASTGGLLPTQVPDLSLKFPPCSSGHRFMRV